VNENGIIIYRRIFAKRKFIIEFTTVYMHKSNRAAERV